MKIDLEYLKDFLTAVQEHDEPDFRIDHPKIKPLWENDEEGTKKLVFHMEILEDQGLIESSISSPGLGFVRTGHGAVNVSLKPLRLTAQGHQFAADLSKPGVFERIKTSFNDCGPTETIRIVFALGSRFLESKLDKYIQ